MSFVISTGKNENDEKRELVFKEDGQGDPGNDYSSWVDMVLQWLVLASEQSGG